MVSAKISIASHSLTHAHYAVWHVGRLRRIAMSVGSGPASGWYPKCVAWSWALPPQFGVRCSLVFPSCTFLQVCSEGLCEWCCPAFCSRRAQSISIAFTWWSPCCLDCSGPVAVGRRLCQAKGFAGLSWGFLYGRLTAWGCRSLSSSSIQSRIVGWTSHSFGRSSAWSWSCTERTSTRCWAF